MKLILLNIDVVFFFLNYMSLNMLQSCGDNCLVIVPLHDPRLWTGKAQGS